MRDLLNQVSVNIAIFNNFLIKDSGLLYTIQNLVIIFIRYLKKFGCVYAIITSIKKSKKFPFLMINVR